MPAPRLIIPKEIFIDLIDKRYSQKEIIDELGIARETALKLLKEYKLNIKAKPDDMIGKRFGKLVVVKRLENSKDRRKVYECKCDCGNTAQVKSKYLYNGDTRSCGCYEKNFTAYQNKNYQDALKRVGEKHGMLTIIDVELHPTRRSYMMVCKCDCGTIDRKVYSQIRRGEIVSCGCYSREQSSIWASSIDIYVINREKKWYFIKNGEKISCRSGYEVMYANYLITQNIEFEYEPECFKLGNAKRYTPDFYIPSEDRYVEIKGISYEVMDRNNQKEKVDIFRKTHRLDIYHWEDILRICDLPYKSYPYYKTVAERIGVSHEDYIGKMLYLLY